MSSRAVFLDRDGVLNRKQPPSTYVTNPGELDVLAGVGKAVRRLNDAGYLSIVVTNQRGIGRGLMSESDLDAVHQKLVAEIAVDGAVLDEIRHCPHDYFGPQDDSSGDSAALCQCRKPAPGMVLDAIAEHNIDRSASILVGDSDTDIAAAAAAGIDGIFIGDAAEVERWPSDAARPVAVHHDLPAAVDWLLSTVPTRSSHRQQRQTEDSK